MNVRVIDNKEYAEKMQQTVTQMLSAMDDKATVQDVRACVIRKHYDEAVTALGGEIDKKALQGSLQLCEVRVKVIFFFILSFLCLVAFHHILFDSG